MRFLRLALVAAIVPVALCGNLAAQDPADAAWNRGDHGAARRLYAERVAADSSDVRALHRLALLHAWNRDYGESVVLFDRLLAAAPENLEARLDRARVLSWARRFDEAYDGYRQLLERRPGDRQALLGLAQALSWSGRLDSAATIYRQILARDSADTEALRGLARVTSWSGDLAGGEALWRRALAVGGDDAPSLVGLSQVLRWQGRLDAARDALNRVPEDQRSERDYQEERRWVAAALDPSIAPAVTYEHDSDSQSITTISAGAGYQAAPRLRVGIDGYYRYASWNEQIVPDRQAWGAMVTGRAVLRGGWTAGLGLGLTGSNGAAGGTHPATRGWLTSPARHRFGGTVSLSWAALDATALIIERGVTWLEMGIALRAEPARRWSVDGGFTFAEFRGTEPNRRLAGTVGVTRSLSPAWAAGVRVRALGFQEDLSDGYFDPSFYALGEVLARWQPFRGPWHLLAEVAPGAEQIETDGDPRATIRLLGRLAYDIAPGRQTAVSVFYSNAGLQSFATGAAGYRYLALTVSGTWVF